MNRFIKVVRHLRAVIMRRVRPFSGYWLAKPSTRPLSAKFGFDRGEPIDRYYMDQFLSQSKEHIKGRVLEIGDRVYTQKYGDGRVTQSDVLDINANNKKANIIDDLRSLKTVASSTYDCIILTHVLGMIDDIDAAVKQLHRVLKPGGKLVVTLSCFSPSLSDNISYWRFTRYSGKYIFSRHFESQKIKVVTYGNVLSAQCFWVGAAQEELSRPQLEYNDPRFPCIVAVLVEK